MRTRPLHSHRGELKVLGETDGYASWKCHAVESHGKRSLNERIALSKTETRLSRNLARDGLEEALLFDIAKMGARRVRKDTLLLIDPTDVRKDYAKKMEYLATVRDGSAGELVKGYWMMEVVGCELGGKRIVPLYQSLYSADAPGFFERERRDTQGGGA